MNFIYDYFRNKIKLLRVPENYHTVNVKFENNELIIKVESETLDPKINKLINNLNSRDIENLLKLLINLHPEYDFTLIDVTRSRLRIIYKFKVWKLYLNIYVIPKELIEIITSYLSAIDTIKIRSIAHLD